MKPTDKWMCQECDWRGLERDLLTAPNPFDDLDIVHGCPQCKSVDKFDEACDEPECWSNAGCGFPTATGYRRTCYKHSDMNITSTRNTEENENCNLR